MARHPERNFFEQIKRNVHKCGYATDLLRVENVAHVGTPDVNYCIGGVEGWVELKAWERVRLSGRFTVPKLREEQATWLLRRAHVGGRAYLLCRINRDVALFDGRLAPLLFDKELKLEWADAERIASTWLKPPIDWEALVAQLRRPPAEQLAIEYRSGLFKPRRPAPKPSNL